MHIRQQQECGLHAWQTDMDDLLDLNWTSSAPSKPSIAVPAQQASTQWKPNSRATSPATYSAFDSLAGASSGHAPNYTSSYASSAGQSRANGSPLPYARTPSPNPPVNVARPQPSTASHDAFDSLFDNAGSKSASQKARESSMTLQDRMHAQSSGLGL